MLFFTILLLSLLAYMCLVCLFVLLCVALFSFFLCIIIFFSLFFLNFILFAALSLSLSLSLSLHLHLNLLCSSHLFEFINGCAHSFLFILHHLLSGWWHREFHKKAQKLITASPPCPCVYSYASYGLDMLLYLICPCLSHYTYLCIHMQCYVAYALLTIYRRRARHTERTTATALSHINRPYTLSLCHIKYSQHNGHAIFFNMYGLDTQIQEYPYVQYFY